jgi:hypothetical protein
MTVGVGFNPNGGQIGLDILHVRTPSVSEADLIGLRPQGPPR